MDPDRHQRADRDQDRHRRILATSCNGADDRCRRTTRRHRAHRLQLARLPGARLRPLRSDARQVPGHPRHDHQRPERSRPAGILQSPVLGRYRLRGGQRRPARPGFHGRTGLGADARATGRDAARAGGVPAAAAQSPLGRSAGPHPPAQAGATVVHGQRHREATAAHPRRSPTSCSTPPRRPRQSRASRRRTAIWSSSPSSPIRCR